MQTKPITTLSDEALIRGTKSLVEDERRITLEILRHLEEIDRRKLHLQRGYSSLHTFCVKELKYSSGAAHRRIQGMLLLKELPQAETAILTGAVNLTTVSQLQDFARKTSKPVSKAELFQKIQNKSTRECERLFVTIDPELPKPEKARAISATHTELLLSVDAEFMTKLEKLRELASHQLKSGTYTEALELALDRAIKDLDPERPRRGEKKSEQAPAEKPMPAPAPELKPDPATPATEPDPRVRTATQSDYSAWLQVFLQQVIHESLEEDDPNRHIPAPVRRFVWRRDGGCCKYLDPLTGKRCGSRRFVQIDHVIPFAQGGSSTDPANLRLLCGKHNRLRSRRAEAAAAQARSAKAQH